MNSKTTKAKRKVIQTFTIAELEEAGSLPPYSYLIDPIDRRLAAEKARKVTEEAKTMVQTDECSKRD